MSREIKFRAWTGKRFEYDFNMYSNGNVIDIEVPYHLPSRLLKWQLSQFTGLQDKNGEDIYEGDIFTANLYPFYYDELLNYVGVIVYDQQPDYMGWFYYLHAVSDRVRGSACGSGLADLAGVDLTIIGNIYEDPEFCTN